MDVMTIITNTNTQLIRQQNNIIRNMRNVIDDTYLQDNTEINANTNGNQSIFDMSNSPEPTENPSTINNPRPHVAQRPPNRRYNRMTRREVRMSLEKDLNEIVLLLSLRQRTQPRENRNRSPV